MDDIVVGMPVVDADGALGTLQSVQHDPHGIITQVTVRRRTSTGTFVPQRSMVVDGVLRLDAGDDQSTEVIDHEVLHERQSGQTGRVEVRAGEELRIPIIREEVTVGTRVVDGGGVRVHKTVTSREEVVEQPSVREHVTVDRIPIGRVVDAAPETRQEGDTLIVPILEETTVILTQLVLKEEVHITRERTRTSEQTRVVLREEQVTVESLDELQAE